jgi:hypothetical protein
MTICVSSDNKYIVSGGFDSVLRIYSIQDLSLKYVFDDD